MNLIRTIKKQGCGATLGVAMLMVTAACSQQGASKESGETHAYGQAVFEGAGFKILDTGASKASVLDLGKHKMEKTVCDPFGGSAGGGITLKNGIKSDLYWLDNQCPRYTKVEEYIRNGVKADQSLFFSDLFTPTRNFTEGFSTQSTETVKNDVGEKLIEYFALDLSSGLRIPAGGQDGAYELALLSDDGTILSIRDGDANLLLINNDGDHETRMGCSSRFVNLTKSSVLNFNLKYYQGPRQHIANVLLWRKSDKAPGGLAGKDPSCGRAGNHMYFNPDQKSAPQQAYKDLLARGWQVVPAEAFVIPDEEDHNPCSQGTAPEVSDFRVNEMMLTGAILSWKTDIAATTQVRYRNLATGEVRTTDSDNRLRTSHTIWLTDLAPSTEYAVEIIAISEDNGRSIYGPELISTNFSANQ